jgi:hypothetical protein
MAWAPAGCLMFEEGAAPGAPCPEQLLLKRKPTYLPSRPSKCRCSAGGFTTAASAAGASVAG